MFTLRRQLFFHHHMGGDARMIHPGLPQHVKAVSALKAAQNIGQGVLQRMPHVQAARHIGGRHADGKGRLAAGGIGAANGGGLPPMIGVGFHLLRFKSFG